MHLNYLNLEGQIPYRRGLEIQEKLHEARKRGSVDDFLILLEHQRVFTTGRRKATDHILVDPSVTGIEVVETTRGGQVTYHGPGQLVGYPIVDLRCCGESVKEFVFRLEELFIRLLKDRYGLTANREKKHRGVWIEGKKILAVGLMISQSVTMHGFAFNVTTDLRPFDWIVPCGLASGGMTSLARVSSLLPSMENFRSEVLAAFCQIFSYSSITERGLSWVEQLK